MAVGVGRVPLGVFEVFEMDTLFDMGLSRVLFDMGLSRVQVAVRLGVGVVPAKLPEPIRMFELGGNVQACVASTRVQRVGLESLVLVE